MKKSLIIFLVLQLNCASILLYRVGGYIGKPLDYFLNEVPEKDKVCKITDAEFHESYFNYSAEFSRAGSIIGLLTDMTLSISYGLQNPTTIPIIGSLIYLFGSFFIPSYYESSSFQTIKMNSSKSGWAYNTKSKCSNLSNFYVREIFIKNKLEVKCNLLEKDAREEFYKVLATNSEVTEKNKNQFKGMIQTLDLIKLEEGADYPNCRFKFYFEYIGGRVALEEKFKININ